ncbi:MAG: hypothetical protein ACJ76Z_05810 [Thermoleophilaceae bacterium]
MSPRTARAPLVAGVALGAATLALLHVWAGWAYWNYSEGVYILSARLIRHGADLYGHVVAAQPPGVFLFGAATEAVHDSLGWVRLVVGSVQLAAGALGAVAVWRLTASRAASVVTPALALLTPWAIHEHGALTPDVLAAPVLLAAALMATRPRTAVAAGALAALAPMIKLPFVIPAVALVLAARNRRAALAFAAVLAVEVAAAFAVFGENLWRDAVVAQLHSGRRTDLHFLLGLWGQEGWNEFGLVLPAAALWWLRERARDPALLRVLAATAAGLLVTVLTNVKSGTGLNVLVPLEAALVPPAVAAAALARGRARPALIAGPAICLVMTASLMASPRTAFPFIYPGSERNAWGRAFSDAGVRTIVAQAARCPRATVYTGPPFFAYLAHRRMPDDQPDQFLTTRSSTLRPVAARMVADSANHCP